MSKPSASESFPFPSSTRHLEVPTPDELRLHHRESVVELESEAVETALCAVAGATVGMLAGPLGAAAGAALGGVVGAALARQGRQAAHEESEHERDLDAGRLDPLPIDPLPVDTLPGMSMDELEAELQVPVSRR
jgi:hypothetical protein